MAIEKNFKTFCLFEGRHELPTNEGAICTSFDFITKKVVKSELWKIARNEPHCKIIVTGLTPALTEFISDWCSEWTFNRGDLYMNCDMLTGFADLTLLHFDSQSGEYWEQRVI
jgi:hypothetical protein